MFISTMNDAEMQREARKDFFELSTKVRIALERFSNRHCNLIRNSQFQYNDMPVCLISRSVENLKWRTRRNNTWISHFRFKHEFTVDDIEIVYFLYTAVPRDKGTEYIFLDNLASPVAKRFTLHFIERYKERHLKPHNIDTGGMPIPLYFQIKNPNCILGRYYKTSDIDVEESTYKKFWIAPEGIYVTDYIDGMLTYITFMDKDDLSPLKKQVYEEEIVWDLMLCIIDKNRSDAERSRAAFRIASTPDLGRIFERFLKRNVQDDGDGEKQNMILRMRKTMAEHQVILQEAKEIAKKRQKEIIRKHKIVGTLKDLSKIEEIEIKQYDIDRLTNGPHTKKT